MSNGARNYKGKESEQSKKRRKKKSTAKAEQLVKGIRKTANNRMPTKGTEIARKAKEFLFPTRKKAPAKTKNKAKKSKRGR